jgi:uncharacterized protein (TIGR02466 family)|tara:strand:+ start:2831 stop:3424 length:594 start_codon:yes stop_codon:yes gene_type:complete
MTQTIFAVPMTSYVFKNKTLNNKLIKFTLDMKKKVKSNSLSNEGGWQSPNVGLSTPIISEFLNYIFPKIREHVKEYKVKHTHNITIQNMWFNVNGPNDYNKQHQHVHDALDFVGVYYMKVPKNSGHMQLMNPDYGSWSSNIFYLEREDNAFNRQTVVVEPTDGLLLLFPAAVVHSVSRNNSKLNRLSLAFNIKVFLK